MEVEDTVVLEGHLAKIVRAAIRRKKVLIHNRSWRRPFCFICKYEIEDINLDLEKALIRDPTGLGWWIDVGELTIVEEDIRKVQWKNEGF